MSKHRENVLIISTDPAHNLSDAFDQKFSGEPTVVKGFENLYGMEIDPTAKPEDGSGALGLGEDMLGGTGGGMEGMSEEMQDSGKSFMKEVMGSIPGIDEATSFG